jgi:hypothetical protein
LYNGNISALHLFGIWPWIQFQHNNVEVGSDCVFHKGGKEQRFVLRSKCSEKGKGGERKTFSVAVSYGEISPTLALFIFSTKIFEIFAFFLEHPACFIKLAIQI